MITTPNERKRYCTLLIPVAYETPLRPLNYIENPDNDNFIKEYEEHGGSREYSCNSMGVLDVNEDIYLKNILISDLPIEPEVFLNLTLCKSEESVETLSIHKRSIRVEAISYNDSKREIFKEEIFLKCITTNSNGLFQYEYEDKGQKLILNRKRGIIHAIYHSIKSFYHEHKYHDPTADSIITPYFSEKQVLLDKLSDPALDHYLKEFKKMFLSDALYLDEIKKKLDDEYLKLENKESTISKEVINAERAKYLNIYRKLLEEHRIVLKKQTYYHALISFMEIPKSIYDSSDIISIEKVLNTIKEQENYINNFLNKEQTKSGIKNSSDTDTLIDIVRDSEAVRNFETILKEIDITTKQVRTLSEDIAKTTEDIKNLSEKAEEAGKKDKRFAFWSFIFAIVITLFLAGTDHYYYRNSASKESINEIKVKLDSINVQFKDTTRHY